MIFLTIISSEYCCVQYHSNSNKQSQNMFSVLLAFAYLTIISHFVIWQTRMASFIAIVHLGDAKLFLGSVKCQVFLKYLFWIHAPTHGLMRRDICWPLHSFYHRKGEKKSKPLWCSTGKRLVEWCFSLQQRFPNLGSRPKMGRWAVFIEFPRVGSIKFMLSYLLNSWFVIFFVWTVTEFDLLPKANLLLAFGSWGDTTFSFGSFGTLGDPWLQETL